jgi:uncharacterized protein (TIGR03437 family)
LDSALESRLHHRLRRRPRDQRHAAGQRLYEISNANPCCRSGGEARDLERRRGERGHFCGRNLAGSWVTIFGSNLAPAGVARSWTNAELASGTLPVSLEGTSVSINGKPAAISYVSETQLNVQAPADDARGNVNVEVTTAAGSSGTVTAQLGTVAPGLFRFQPREYRYVAAVHADGTLLAPADLLGAGPSPAKPGETILLFGTGFGATTPDVPPGALFSGAAPLASGNALSIRIGGVQAQVQFAGLSAAGLYQFNVVVPDLPDGDHLLEASAGALASARNNTCRSNDKGTPLYNRAQWHSFPKICSQAARSRLHPARGIGNSTAITGWF